MKSGSDGSGRRGSGERKRDAFVSGRSRPLSLSLSHVQQVTWLSIPLVLWILSWKKFKLFKHPTHLPTDRVLLLLQHHRKVFLNRNRPPPPAACDWLRVFFFFFPAHFSLPLSLTVLCVCVVFHAIFWIIIDYNQHLMSSSNDIPSHHSNHSNGGGMIWKKLPTIQEWRLDHMKENERRSSSPPNDLWHTHNHSIHWWSIISHLILVIVLLLLLIFFITTTTTTKQNKAIYRKIFIQCFGHRWPHPLFVVVVVRLNCIIFLPSSFSSRNQLIRLPFGL